MKKVLAAAVMVLVLAGVAFAKSYEVKKKAGENSVTVTIDKNPPVVGDNGVTIAITDSAGKAVTDAKVRLDYSMPAMPGMPAMSYKTDSKQEGSVYKAKMSLSMGGSWNIAVKVSLKGKMSTIRFSIDAQ